MVLFNKYEICSKVSSVLFIPVILSYIDKKSMMQEIEPFLKIEESFDVLSTKTIPWA